MEGGVEFLGEAAVAADLGIAAEEEAAAASARNIKNIYNTGGNVYGTH